MGNSGERISEALHAKAPEQLILKSVTGNLPSLSTLPIFTFCDSYVIPFGDSTKEWIIGFGIASISSLALSGFNDGIGDFPISGCDQLLQPPLIAHSIQLYDCKFQLRTPSFFGFVGAGTSKKNRQTFANGKAIKLSSEDASKIEATHLERILPQLLLDF
ncbi:protein MHF2 homolog [Fagus crenata]